MKECDYIVGAFALQVKRICQLIDGLDTIVDMARSRPKKHDEVFEEAYKKFCSWSLELKKEGYEVLQCLSFVPHTAEAGDCLRALEEGLAKIREQDEAAKQLAQRENSFLDLPLEAEIGSPAFAILLYSAKEKDLVKMHQLLAKLESLAKRLGYDFCGIGLLTVPKEQPKRQEIFKLFDFYGVVEEQEKQ